MGLPRGTCIVCGQDVAMRNNGVTREHRKRIDPKLVGGKCSGSAMRSRERIDAKADASVAEREAAAASPVVLLRPASEPVP
jgi:hypothetical protein